jgi:tripartite-type tricarboxylate transporter receptor subunit TctC
MLRTAACSARRAASSAIVIAAALAIAMSAAQAQDWPQRNVKLILPFGAGSATDVAARLLGDRLGVKWGKSVVVENRPGADGLIAINAFIGANDDHVLLYASSASFIAHPYMHEKLPYVLERDLEPIARVCDTILTVGVPTASGIGSIADFVARARAEPQRYNVAGAAGLPEFAVSAFLKSENLAATKVPYRDVLQAGRDLGEGRIQFLLSSYAVVAPLIQADKVRVVASGVPTPLLPGVPTVRQAGYPVLHMETTSGLYGPRGMPLDLRRRIGAEVVAAASEPAVTQRIEASGQVMRTGGPAELAAALKDQAATAAGVAKILGMEKK